MKWWKQWGEHFGKLVAISKLGRRVKALESLPELSSYEREMEHHFNMLCSNRFVPFTEIDAYCRLRGITSLDEKEELLSIFIEIGRAMSEGKDEGRSVVPNVSKHTTRKPKR